MIITEMTRGQLKIEDGDRSTTIEGEMLFLENGKLGFAMYLDTVKIWETLKGSVPMTRSERERIIDFIKFSFKEKDRYLELL